MVLQAEPRAALNLASQSLSENLVIRPDDMVLFSAKAIPGNEKRVQKMLNSLSNLGALIINGRNDGLHASGHAYSGEQEEVYSKPHCLAYSPYSCENTQSVRRALPQPCVRSCDMIKCFLLQT